VNQSNDNLNTDSDMIDETLESEIDFEVYQDFVSDITAEDIFPIHNEDNKESEKEETFLFVGSNVTVSAAMVLILTYSIRFSLSHEALSHLLLLLHILLPDGSRLCKTLYNFTTHFKSLKGPVTFHIFCTSCYNESSNKETVCVCGKDLTLVENKSFLIEFPIINQLLKFFKRQGFYENLNYISKFQSWYFV